jgi:hypothetical protein
MLKRLYNRQIKVLIKAYIYYITKVEFFITFKTVYPQLIIIQNTQARFRGAGLVFFNPQAVISKLDMKL